MNQPRTDVYRQKHKNKLWQNHLTEKAAVDAHKHKRRSRMCAIEKEI